MAEKKVNPLVELNNAIASGEFAQIYLLYGEEAYLKRQYKNKLKQAIIGDDSMNYTYFEGKQTSVRDIIDTGDTMPFFAERRLIIIENSNYLKASNDELAEFLKTLPDYLNIIFIESEIDKRNKVYNAINKFGVAYEIKCQTPATLKKWIITLVKAEGKQITSDACDILLNKTCANMDLIHSEIEKLICYAYDDEVITAAHVNACCQTVIEDHIFKMIQAVADKKQSLALSYYFELVELKTASTLILNLMISQFNGILQAKELKELGNNNKEIESKIKAAPYAIQQYIVNSNNFTISELKDSLKLLANVISESRIGNLSENLSTELAIVQLSTRNFITI